MGLEDAERDQRSQERRLRSAQIGQSKSLTNFEWERLKRHNRPAIQEPMTRSFMADASNVTFIHIASE
jgi:DNA replication protein DnaC